MPNLFWMVILVGDPGLRLPAPQPLGPLSLRGRLQRGGGAPVRRQRRPRRSTSPTSCPRPARAFVGVLLASRIGIGNADPGGRLGAAGDRLLGHRRHQPVRRGRLGARPAARRLHPGHHQQRRQPAQRQLVLAAHHHRRADHRHRLFRPALRRARAKIPRRLVRSGRIRAIHLSWNFKNCLDHESGRLPGARAPRHLDSRERPGRRRRAGPGWPSAMSASAAPTTTSSRASIPFSNILASWATRSRRR